MTVLTDEEQALVGPILACSMPTTRARLRRVVRIDFDCHAPGSQRFVGNHGVQLGKGPLGVRSVGFPLLLRGVLALASFCALSNVGQVLQTDDTVGVLIHNTLTHDMVRILFQPSLSSTDGDQLSGRGTSAFVLKTLAQSCIMVGFRSYVFARMKRACSFRGARDRKIAQTDIDADDVRLWREIGYVNFQCDEQVKLLLGRVVPTGCATS